MRKRLIMVSLRINEVLTMTPALTGMQQQKYRRKTLSSGIGATIDAFPDAGILLFIVV